jgi:hypothetical protein
MLVQTRMKQFNIFEKNPDLSLQIKEIVNKPVFEKSG